MKLNSAQLLLAELQNKFNCITVTIELSYTVYDAQDFVPIVLRDE